MSQLRLVSCFAAAASLSVFIAAPSWSGTFTGSTGLEFLTGTYGKSESTDELTVPLSLRYTEGPWTARVRVPLSRVDGIATALEREVNVATFDVDGDGDVDSDDDDDLGETTGAATGSGSSAMAPAARQETGLGDAIVSGSYGLLRQNEAPVGVDLGVRAKLPLNGDNCLLSNGEADYSVEATAYRTFGRIEPAVTVGWTRRGDPERRSLDCRSLGGQVDLENPFYLGLGADVKLAGPFALEARFLFREKLRSGSDPLQTLRIGLQYRATEAWAASVFGLVGFTDASPDWGVGAGIGYRF